ncbi:helix-turn-helix domain-containing protein [Nitratireductor sp. GZWM139]|uniref:helix-turn-helix domain-containing protein n=1 Tax=Nitratireductor sp. GZWM139 TaxID=2950541 RepID=UPI0024BDA4AC|nr:helix-turn-helix domain-containing protein [Nitratireductor sp. GZWM139]
MQDDLLARQASEINTLRERIRQLEEALSPASIEIPMEWGLTATEARIFSHMATRDVARKDAIMLAVYGGRSGEMPDEKIVDVLICKMRKKLAAFGVQIQTVWGIGYALRDRCAYSAGSGA